MTETQTDPWARVIPLRPNPYSHQNYYVEEEVNAARAAVERQHAAALAEKDAQIAELNNSLANEVRTVLAAGNATLRAQVETLTAELDEARAANTANLREMVGMEGRHRASLAAVEGERDRLRGALRLDQPWPVQQLLTKLAGAADHLLHGHDCDRHGWDEIGSAAQKAREVVVALDAALTSPTQETTDV